ncbi:MAG: hypothetical protein ACQ9MH_15680 [Nitrospinales bacterium]
MKFKKLAVVCAMSLVVIGTTSFSHLSLAADGLADGIDIESGNGWSIEENTGRTGGWLWHGGGKSGKAATRKDAKKAAKAAKKEGKGVRDTNEPGCNEPGVIC